MLNNQTHNKPSRPDYLENIVFKAKKYNPLQLTFYVLTISAVLVALIDSLNN